LLAIRRCKSPLQCGLDWAFAFAYSPVAALPLCRRQMQMQRGKCEAANAAQVKKSEKRKVKMRETIGVLCILFISCR